MPSQFLRTLPYVSSPLSYLSLGICRIAKHISKSDVGIIASLRGHQLLPLLVRLVVCSLLGSNQGGVKQVREPRLCLRQRTLTSADTRDLLSSNAGSAWEPRQGVFAEGQNISEVLVEQRVANRSPVPVDVFVGSTSWPFRRSRRVDIALGLSFEGV